MVSVLPAWLILILHFKFFFSYIHSFVLNIAPKYKANINF